MASCSEKRRNCESAVEETHIVTIADIVARTGPVTIVGITVVARVRRDTRN